MRHRGTTSSRRSIVSRACETFEARRLFAGTLDIAGGHQTFATLADTTVTMTGQSELHITAAASPISGSTFHLNSPDAWLFFENVKPSVVNSTYRTQIRVDGATAVHGTNVRIVQHEMGSVVIPHAPSFRPLTVYTNANFAGTARTFAQNTIHNTAGELGEQNNAASSFRLKRGYMATIAADADGGKGKVYVAQDHDLDISYLPTSLNDSVEFIRVLPWRWVSKKGASDLGPGTLNAQWFYNWANDKSSTLDAEYVPIRQQRFWPGLPGEGQKDVTHLLGFNEPDNPVEDAYQTLGNGSRTAALDYWPAMEATGLRLGAPAVTDGGKWWLFEFMDGAIARGLRVDYIPIHFYRGQQTAASFKSFLQEVYDRYHLPMWVTEFNNGANWTSPVNSYSANATAIESFVDMLDATPWVERYAVYHNVGQFRNMVYNEGGRTPAGNVYYDNASPIGYVQPATPGQNRAMARFTMDGDVLDRTGRGNNGQTVDSPAHVAGQRGQALQFDGNNHVRLVENTARGDNLSFAGWVNWDGGPANQRVFDFGDGTNEYVYLTPSSASGTMRFGIKNGGATQFVETAAPPVGQWTHVAATIGGGAAKLYVNGTLRATASVTIKPSDFDPASNYLGKSQWGSDPKLRGRLDEVMITDDVMTAAQVAALVTNNAPAFASGSIVRGPTPRGTAYTGTLAGEATDADAGDAITYSKIKGPSWLTVAANGALSGTPGPDEPSRQEFVVAATDSRGAITAAALTIQMTEFYWRGDVNGTWSTNDAGNTNWSYDAAGTTESGTVPTVATPYDVVFAADNAANLNTTLGSDFTIVGLRVTSPSSVAVGGPNRLTIGAGGLALVAGGGATTIHASDVTLAAPQTWANDSTNPLTVNSVVSGTGLTKAGGGRLTLNGANTYAGGTTHREGTIAVGNDAAFGTGTIDLRGGSVQSVDAAARTIANAITLSADTTFGGTGHLLFTGAVNAGNLDKTFTVANARTEFSGVIGGAGARFKDGAGTLVLSGANTYGGGMTLLAGTIAVGHNAAFGTGVLELVAGSVQSADAAARTVANAITLSGDVAFNGTGDLRFTGAVAGGSLDKTFIVDNVRTEFAGVISGSGAREKAGNGTLVLSAANTYGGGTTVSAGTLAVGHNAAFGTGTIDLRGGAIWSADATARAIPNAITLSANTTFGGTGDLRFTGAVNAGSLAKTFTVDNARTEFGGVISGSGARVKAGGGTLVFSGANTYTGSTTIAGGALVLTTAASGVALDAGAAGVDLQGGKLVLDYTGGSSPAAQVQAILDAGYDQATKFGAGRLRSTTLADGRLLGWTDDGSRVTVAPTLAGDATLDGRVDFADLLSLAGNYTGGAGKGWGQGDFNYDGAVGFADLLSLAGNYDGAAGAFADLARASAPAPAKARPATSTDGDGRDVLSRAAASVL